uniref:Immunoglobulin domain-containing protein n=1 Tax=Seriola lalandi dorsalis TaxID=1841481 RepID=A0A3B4YSC7_SERLL
MSLLLRDLLPVRIHSVNTVSKVSVMAGDSITIPCLYGSQYMNNVKYLCKGYYWSSCSYAVKTNQPHSSGKFSISDDKNQRIFTVTIKDLMNTDTDYWCNVEINGRVDVGQYFHLSITTDTPSLSVDHQEITGFIGESINISCYYRNSGERRWCRLGMNCVTGSSVSIDGTSVTISATVPNVFTVTMSGLKTESSGWYYCVKGELQMPVHVTVTERPTTSKYYNSKSTKYIFISISQTQSFHCVTTVSKVSVKAGDSITIPCRYGSEYMNNVKYLCKGSHWKFCSYAVETNQPHSSEKFSISDDKNQNIFTVTIKDLTNTDTDYWCFVEINGGADDGQYFHLSITTGKTPLKHL